MNVAHIEVDSPLYPSSLRQYLAERAPSRLAALGNVEILRSRKLALFCSVKCPGKLILATHELGRSLRDIPLTVVGGFHSPTEKEFLRIMVQGRQPIIVCLARSLEDIRLPSDWKAPLNDGRLLLLSAAGPRIKRPTAASSDQRNQVAAALADEICIAYAAPGGKVERFVNELLLWGKRVMALDFPENGALFARGVKPCTLNSYASDTSN